jgi:hypothetical protein
MRPPDFDRNGADVARDMVPCLSIRQPYAWLIVHGIKPVENRTWSTKFRGRVLIHAGVTYAKRDHHDDLESWGHIGYPATREEMVGGIVGGGHHRGLRARAPERVLHGALRLRSGASEGIWEADPARGSLGVLRRAGKPPGGAAVTVYVDDMKAAFGRMKMCHMLADTDDELHAMADRIGVSRRWWQLPAKTSGSHYDIAMSKRALAVAAGAVEITWRQASAMNARRRVTGQLGVPGEAWEWLAAHRAARAAERQET